MVRARVTLWVCHGCVSRERESQRRRGLRPNTADTAVAQTVTPSPAFLNHAQIRLRFSAAPELALPHRVERKHLGSLAAPHDAITEIVARCAREGTPHER